MRKEGLWNDIIHRVMCSVAKRYVRALAGLCLAGFAIAVFIWQEPFAPRYEGLTVAQWLREARGQAPNENAVAAFGTKAYPDLVRVLDHIPFGQRLSWLGNVPGLNLLFSNEFAPEFLTALDWFVMAQHAGQPALTYLRECGRENVLRYIEPALGMPSRAGSGPSLRLVFPQLDPIASRTNSISPEIAKTLRGLTNSPLIDPPPNARREMAH